jgi:spore coat protein A
MTTRRDFIRFVAGTGFVYYTFGPGGAQRAFAESLPGGSLMPDAISRFITPVLIPPAMPRAGKIKLTGNKNIDYYEIAMRQFQQQILPASLPATTVWGYGPVVAMDGPAIFNAPSLTIEAKHNTPVRIRWTNQLTDGQGNFLPHLLAVDPTLHWANPPGGSDGRDMRPVFADTPPPYTGPVPMVTHVHGSERVGDESDGYAEAWYLPQAANIPAGYATQGTWYDYFSTKAAGKFGVVWEPGSAICQYPNSQRASTAWYHDHTLGMTRLNVYAGPAGFFIVRGGPDDMAIDTRTGKPAVLPGPAPAIGDLAGISYYEIPLAIQDRAFNADGSLFYPSSREFFDGVSGPYIPATDISPIWNPEFFGNCIIVNGNTWPHLVIEQRRYRFRMLNGCNSRFLIVDFSGIPGAQVWQIGSEGGFLAAPVDMTALNSGKLLMSPAERADIIVDFTNVPLGAHTLRNIGPDEPFSGGIPGEDFMPADPDSTGQIMEFRVVATRGRDKTTPPGFLQLPPIAPLTPTMVRPLALIEEMSVYFDDAPAEALLGTVSGNPNNGVGTWVALKWEDAITENPEPEATEMWEFYNATADAHPIHIHEVLFQVVNRQSILVNEDTQQVMIVPDSNPLPPEPWETGFKDTVIAYPNQVTRVTATFGSGGQFVWHCHIVEHEDNEMMRPYRVGPLDPAAP